MTPEECEAVASRAAQQAVLAVVRENDANVKAIVAESVRATLTQLGIEHASPIEMQRDFQHLRQWRKAGEDLRSKGLVFLLTVFLSGLVALLVAGFKGWFSSSN